MPQFDEKHVRVDGCLVLWDAITRPDISDANGRQKWSLKVAVHPSSPDIALLEQLANTALHESEFKGVLPNGGTMPVGTLGPAEYSGQFNGWKVFNCGTYRGVPDIFVDNVAADVMQISNALYGGQKVDVLVHCYAYNNKAKGVALGLDGFNIQAAAQAPRLDVGGGPGVDTASAFGAPAAAAPAAAAPAAAAPAAAAPAAAAPAAAPGAPMPAQADSFLPGQTPAPAAPAEPKYKTPDGGEWTEAQLVGAGWAPEQIRTLPQA